MRCFKYYIISLLSVLMLIAGSCKNHDDHPGAAIKIDLKTSRFDVDLYGLDTNKIGPGLEQLHSKYPDFLNFYLDTLMGLGIRGNYNDTVAGIRQGLRIYLTYKDFVRLEDSIKTHFPDTKISETELTKGFQNMKYYFPAFHVPKVYFVNTELNNLPAFTLDTSIIGVSLDMFLGDNFVPYTQVQIPNYLFPHIRPSYMPVSVFKVVYSSLYPYVQEDKVLLDLMLQRGKEFYYLHKMLPETPDSVIFGFTQKQVEWCNHNEAFIYNFFIHQNLLFEKELLKTIPYVNDGPFARGIGSAADSEKLTPGNIGSWLGYRMISSYMDNHPDIPIKAMLDMKKEPNILLEEAKYKPK